MYDVLVSIRFFLYCKRRLGPCQNQIHKTVYGGGSIDVKGGPFKGLKYYNRTIWGTITSKWLGCYEEEIQSVIHEIIQEEYPVIVDIGAAEGYYAVGLAWRLPQSQVISFDTDPIARHRQHQLAELNKINNLDVRKRFIPSCLEKLPEAKTVIICDVEGFEVSLLDPSRSDRFTTCDILVETHPSGALDVPQVESLLVDRFKMTHEIERFQTGDRNVPEMRKRVPSLAPLTDDEVAFALDEGRYVEQVWLWLRSKPGSNPQNLES